jgi:NAD+ synthase
MKFHKDTLLLENVPAVCEMLQNEIKTHIFNTLRRRGGIVGISGGIDSSVTLALTVRAIGKDKVLGIMLPEKDSSEDSARLATLLADQLGVKTKLENLTGALEGFGCYRRRDEAVARVFPQYDPKTYKMKIGIRQGKINTGLPPIFHLTIVDPDGKEMSKIIPLAEYSQIVAASNLKQRSRMSMLYYHAECLHYAVVGTPNKHEVEQGFFVKYGDGGADLMPISKLYKTNVYQLAEYLQIPDEIIKRTPTTDTYTAEQTQEEFFYQFPYKELDVLWYAFENQVPPVDVSEELKIPESTITKIFENFNRKQQTAEYLRRSPIQF